MTKNQEIALNNHINRMGLHAKLQYINPGYWRLNWTPQSSNKVSIIILGENEWRLVNLINSANQTTHDNYEIVLLILRQQLILNQILFQT